MGKLDALKILTRKLLVQFVTSIRAIEPAESSDTRVEFDRRIPETVQR